MVQTIASQQEGSYVELGCFLCLCEFPLGALISLAIKKCTVRLIHSGTALMLCLALNFHCTQLYSKK